ncbi:C-type lectin 1 [Liparis tanakae]|uniref:C-type lectin 1 n=1 Tax=Liparis tanakae TaxID=230148 RepID=A0A4Z2GJF8_9TELE|nr:C-type lectin 1 [Liparis tanakae]
MERRLLGIVILSGLCRFTSSAQYRQYSFISTPKNWTEARRYCLTKHTDLASVHDGADVEKLSALITAGVPHVFLGLYRRWDWSRSAADSYRAGEKTFWKWVSGEPLDHPHFCGSIDGTGEWSATDCSKRMNFTCYDEMQTAPAQRFHLGGGLKSWDDAQTACRARHTDLAMVRDLADNEELKRMATDYPIWIGLTGTAWAWSDGSEPTYTPWSRQDPAPNGIADCAGLDVGSDPLGMIESNCAEPKPFICYEDAVRQRVVGLRLTADSSLDITDPAVMESILNTVAMKLKEEGASVGVRLRWRKVPEKLIIPEDAENVTDIVCPSVLD